jgi:enoyl-CoA hydratase/carnithine racemase
VGQPEVGFGAIPGAGGTQLLLRINGKGAGIYFLITSENISAQGVHRLCLVDQVVPDDKLMATSLTIAQVIGQKGPL